ncbi:MAG TPA: hypothetical protein VKS25_09145 [Solirubrobacteraceae bacterium]|nr:hypothetical protein [Solirubrobacteraceae bacterium]
MRMTKAKLTAVLTAAVIALAGAVAAPAAYASHGETVFFEAPRDLIGVSAATQQATITKLQGLGVHALRIVLYWGLVAPSPKHRTRPHFNQASPSAYHWGSYDALIDAAAALHWQILLTVSGGFGTVPRWATPHGEDQYTDPNATDFGQFMEAVGKHYGKKVKLISIWNEPNQPQYLRPQYVKGKLVSPSIYRALFLSAYNGLKKSGNFSGMKVLMGETSPVGVKAAGIPAPLAFMRGVLCLDSNYHPIGHCSLLPADGYAQHPYTEGPGPFWIPNNHLDPNHDDVTIATLGRLVTALDRAASAGAVKPGLPVYVTEMGIQSTPKPYYGVSLAQQAEYDAISEKIAWSNPRVASSDQYLLRDDPPTKSHIPLVKWSGFETGLESYSGHKKPSFYEFRLPFVVARTGTGVSLWGIARPVGAPPSGPGSSGGGSTGATGSTGSTTNSGPVRSVTIQYSSDGGKSWRTLMHVPTDSSGAFSASGNFAAHRLWRVKWVSASGTVSVGAATRAYSSNGKVDY